MKLKLTLLTFCLFGIGIFSHAQDEKATPPKVKFKASKGAPRDQDGNLLPPPPPPKIDRIHFKAPKGGRKDKDGNFIDPPPPPPEMNAVPATEPETGKYGNPSLPPPKVEVQRFKAPKGAPRDKDGNLLPPPPPPPIDRNGNPTKIKQPEKVRFAPPKIVKDKPVNPNTPPAPDERS